MLLELVTRSDLRPSKNAQPVTQTPGPETGVLMTGLPLATAAFSCLLPAYSDSFPSPFTSPRCYRFFILFFLFSFLAFFFWYRFFPLERGCLRIGPQGVLLFSVQWLRFRLLFCSLVFFDLDIKSENFLFIIYFFIRCYVFR